MLKFYHFLLLSTLFLFPFPTSYVIQAQVAEPYDYRQGIDLHPEITNFVNGESKPSSNQSYSRNLHSNSTLDMVSFLSLPDHPISDVWALGDYAYVGGWGPNTTVHVVDISDPANPAITTTIDAMGPGTSPQDVKAGKISTPYFKGDMLVVGNDGFQGGIELYDVNDPKNPILLGSYAEPFVHNTYLYERWNRAFVLMAVPTREVGHFCCPDIVPTPGEFLIIEVTDPTDPHLIGEWAAGADGGFGFGFPGFPPPPNDCSHCRGSFFPSVNLHDVWANEQGTMAYLAYWDLGLVILDISDPSSPSLISQTTEPPALGSDEGDCHVAVPAHGGNLVLVGDETFFNLPWGFLRIFDTRDPYNPVQVGTYATPNTLTNTDFDRWSSMHNLIVRGNRAFISWYNEGIRVIDFSNPSEPEEVAYFQAPAGTTDPSLMWGVYVHKSHILASDISGGLFILDLPNNSSAPLSKDKTLANSVMSLNSVTGFENFPNPFRSETKIIFHLNEETKITLKVYDQSGKVVRKLAESILHAGEQSFVWDGKDDMGIQMLGGVYICQLVDGNFIQHKKLTLIR